MMEVVIAPLTSARPGFDAVYNLVWRNKGNTTLSGKVILNYDKQDDFPEQFFTLFYIEQRIDRV
jgi:hypothetical protein